MKIAITGHSHGIGKHIFEFFSSTADVVGLSRSNGYDINNVGHILDAVSDADVFINNAYCGFQQAILLEELYNQWSNTNKRIISIGSSVTDYPRIESDLDKEPWPYRAHKQALQKKFRELIQTPNGCYISLINPGPTDTVMIKDLSCVKLDTSNITEAVVVALANPLIKEIIIYAK